MTNPHTIAGVLEKAADLIEPEGAWTQGASFRDKLGAMVEGDNPNKASQCLVGAVSVVCGFHYDAAAEVFAFLELRLGEDAADWNDAPERTQAEVVAKLREAAAAARKASQ